MRRCLSQAPVYPPDMCPPPRRKASFSFGTGWSRGGIYRSPFSAIDDASAAAVDAFMATPATYLFLDPK